jgi:hypothetical protein
MLCRQPSRNSVGAGSFPYLSHSDGYETRIKASVKDASLRVKVSYAVSAALSAVGDNRLLPSPQNSVLVINMKSGYVRQNQSYVISRIFRDYDYWKDPQIDKAETQRLADLQQLEDDTARIEKRDPVKVRMGLKSPGQSSKTIYGEVESLLCLFSLVLLLFHGRFTRNGLLSS